MTDEQLSQRLQLTADITLYLQLYADEATRAEPSRAYLEAHASRILKRAAELFAASRQPAGAEVRASAPLPPVPDITHPRADPLPHVHHVVSKEPLYAAPVPAFNVDEAMRLHDVAVMATFNNPDSEEDAAARAALHDYMKGQR
jgi:hypothetical protein